MLKTSWSHYLLSDFLPWIYRKLQYIKLRLSSIPSFNIIILSNWLNNFIMFRLLSNLIWVPLSTVAVRTIQICPKCSNRCFSPSFFFNLMFPLSFSHLSHHLFFISYCINLLWCNEITSIILLIYLYRTHFVHGKFDFRLTYTVDMHEN